ncbi:cbb3-type cytochrome oxidase assembly protein CcoS [Lysobacter sp. HDW10]|jgi:cbb3-type cytochrome oxidase maturation protein|uniref:cbb3-type cytochrome oxidase assembly protein CcoS n=1 Tax=Lysobacter sp. HDW10 TaxID=2714936 RepID=UPI00140B5A42|nr:cbb3-type cytochrome oxidase assembly protein CcoS [Lysobacter sp. HDW10]QIK80201.1 cbb3-type cytochrome oxidase assembly protein CcoS [Lysobacter sp. HDW10]
MNMLLLLIPISLMLLVVAILMFVWAVKKGQFENLDSAALDILVDDETDTSTSGKADAD